MRRPEQFTHMVVGAYRCGAALKALPGGAWFDGAWWVTKDDYRAALVISVKAAAMARKLAKTKLAATHRAKIVPMARVCSQCGSRLCPRARDWVEKCERAP